ncbi:MAG: hypothetical protein KGH71_03940 [Candidatus Micrarchaeota archaeon]|nr:hypothetical protein [Candidatus Micrarchaeota archaeon]
MFLKKQDMSFKISAEGRTLEIFISNKKVEADNSDSVVPKGYRKISLEEGAFAWRNSENFRNNLANDNEIWTNKKGLQSRGYYKIETDNTFIPLETEDSSGMREYYKLPIIERSHHCDGNGLVSLSWFEGLSLNAQIISNHYLQVAYTKISENNDAESADNTELRQRAQRELEFLNKIMKPEAIEAISELVRVG